MQYGCTGEEGRSPAILLVHLQTTDVRPILNLEIEMQVKLGRRSQGTVLPITDPPLPCLPSGSLTNCQELNLISFWGSASPGWYQGLAFLCSHHEIPREIKVYRQLRESISLEYAFGFSSLQY